jgi:hypothetical protein
MNQVELVHWVVVNFQLGKPLAQGIINIILNKQQHNEQFNHMKFVAKVHFYCIYIYLFIYFSSCILHCNLDKDYIFFLTGKHCQPSLTKWGIGIAKHDNNYH